MYFDVFVRVSVKNMEITTFKIRIEIVQTCYPLYNQVIISFKIIYYRPFLFQKYIYLCKKTTCVKSLCPITARGGG